MCLTADREVVPETSKLRFQNWQDHTLFEGWYSSLFKNSGTRVRDFQSSVGAVLEQESKIKSIVDYEAAGLNPKSLQLATLCWTFNGSVKNGGSDQLADQAWSAWNTCSTLRATLTEWDKIFRHIRSFCLDAGSLEIQCHDPFQNVQHLRRTEPAAHIHSRSSQQDL